MTFIFIFIIYFFNESTGVAKHFSLVWVLSPASKKLGKVMLTIICCSIDLIKKEKNDNVDNILEKTISADSNTIQNLKTC